MFYPRLFNEGVADKYAEKEFYIPQEIKGQEDVINQTALKNDNKVIIETLYAVIVKNPASLKKIGGSVRAVFSKEGNLYVASNRNIVHSVMVDELVKAKEIENQEHWWSHNPKHFITLTRIGKTKKFAVGESNYTMDPNYDEHSRENSRMPYFEECEAYFQDYIDEANKLFPQFKFINTYIKNINEI
mgnify:CR=1 FL=1